MLTLIDCHAAIPIEHSTIDVINKLIFNPRKAYTISSDGKTYYDFGSRILSRLHNIKRRVNNHTYRFKPCLKISKRTKNKIRDLYLSCWDDKIVETWLNDSLNICLGSWFSKNTFAYRIDDLGLDSCQHQIYNAVRQDKYFVKRDIIKYFYSIDHQYLLKQLRELVDPNDFLFELIRQRIQFEYKDNDTLRVATVGIPFGSALACTLSNIHLTDIDKAMQGFDVNYFRYADDILITSQNPSEALRAAEYFDKCVVERKLSLKASHSISFAFCEYPGFELVSKFKHLGLEFTKDGLVKFSVEKQRKIMNFFKRELNRRQRKIRSLSSLDEKLTLAIDGVNMMVTNRIRSAAIVDYYLKHVNDENQLRIMDRLVAELVIGMVLDKTFRRRDFRRVSYGKLRKMGLISLLHRSRLHRHGQLRVSFLSLHNELVYRRYADIMLRRRQRIDQMRLSRKLSSQRYR